MKYQMDRASTMVSSQPKKEAKIIEIATGSITKPSKKMSVIYLLAVSGLSKMCDSTYAKLIKHAPKSMYEMKKEPICSLTMIYSNPKRTKLIRIEGAVKSMMSPKKSPLKY